MRKRKKKDRNRSLLVLLGGANHFSGTEAAGADRKSHMLTVYDDLDRTDIGFPHSVGGTM